MSGSRPRTPLMGSGLESSSCGFVRGCRVVVRSVIGAWEGWLRYPGQGLPNLGTTACRAKHVEACGEVRVTPGTQQTTRSSARPRTAADPGVGLVCGRPSVEVERGLDGCAELGFLLRQEETELAPERADRNGDDVVAADDTGVIEPVGPAHRNLRGQPANRAGDRRDGDPAEVGTHDLTGE